MNGCVVVTGSAHGIGTSIAKAFLSTGTRVLLADFNEKLLLSTTSELKDVYGDLVFSVTADLSSADGVEKVVTAAKQLPERVVCIVNNAADQTPGTTETTNVDMFQRTMFINVTAPFLLVQGLLDDLIATKGTVVNVGSLVGNQPIPGRVAYNTSKAAIAGLTRSLAVDLGQSGIRECSRTWAHHDRWRRVVEGCLFRFPTTDLPDQLCSWPRRPCRRSGCCGGVSCISSRTLHLWHYPSD